MWFLIQIFMNRAKAVSQIFPSILDASECIVNIPSKLISFLNKTMNVRDGRTQVGGQQHHTIAYFLK